MRRLPGSRTRRPARCTAGTRDRVAGASGGPPGPAPSESPPRLRQYAAANVVAAGRRVLEMPRVEQVESADRKVDVAPRAPGERSTQLVIGIEKRRWQIVDETQRRVETATRPD